MLKAREGSIITVDRGELAMAKMVEGVEERCLHVTTAVSWGTSVLNVISHLEWEEICILCLHNCQIGQMIMV